MCWAKRFTPLLFLALVLGCTPTDRYRFTSASPSQWRSWWLLMAPGGALFDGTTGAPEDAPPREVTEPDVYRRDANLLYVLNQYRGLILIDLDSQTILAQAPTFGFPRDIYIAGSRAYVLVGNAHDCMVEGNTVSISVSARLYVVDVADPSDPEIVASFDLEGDLVDSRLVGDVLYAVCAEYEWSWIEDGVTAGVEVVKNQTSASWVTSVNIADPNHIYEADEVAFGGTGNVIQATPSAIYVAASDWPTDTTEITYVDISDPNGTMAVRGSALVRGHVADRFKMDEWNGVLRVVSNAWADQRRVFITTISLSNPDHLEVLAETELERAVGETLFATRFDGPRAYVVTFLVKDPLFVIDLSDPLHPEVAGELEIPGWSTHIEPQGDRLVALGVDDTGGVNRVCVRLFDVSDPGRPSLLDLVSFGQEWAWSSAYSDVKAFTVLQDLLIVPFSGWLDRYGSYDRLQFVSYSRNDLALRGYVDVEGDVLRSFEYDQTYFGLTTEELVAINGSDLDHPVVTHRLILAENLAEFLELSPALGAAVMPRLDTHTTIVRTTAIPDKGLQPLAHPPVPTKALGEVEVEIGNLINAHAYGPVVVLVGAMYDEIHYTSYVRVAMVDCSNPAAPQQTAVLNLDVAPCYGWWYWPLYAYDAPRPSKSVMAPWRWCSPNSTFLLRDTLAIRCRADDYDIVLGDRLPHEGVALVDLRVPAETSTVGFGYEQVVSLDAAADKLFIGSSVDAGFEGPMIWPISAFFLTELDVTGPSAGPRVNVPGTFVQYDADSDVLTLKDTQWSFPGLFSPDAALTVQLRTVRWYGSENVEPIDALTLPDSVATVLGCGPTVFFTLQEEGFRLASASLSSAGFLTMGQRVIVTDQWGNLLGGRQNTAYVSIGNAAVARYAFDGAPHLTNLVPVMGSPSKVRFGTDRAYIPLGYFGLVTLPL